MVFLFRGISNLVFALLILEILSWIFTLLLRSEVALKYLLVQRFFLLFGVIGLFWFWPFLVLAFLLKIGLPPFHSWIIAISVFFRTVVFTLFLSLHKILPLLVLGKRLLNFNRFYLLVAAFLIAAVLLFQAVSLFFVIILSSIIHRIWIILSCLLSFRISLLYWFLYSILISILMLTAWNKELKYLFREQSSVVRVVWLVLTGFPPFTIFWLKIFVIRITIIISLWGSFTILISSVLALFSYFRSFHVRVTLTSIFNTWYLSLLTVIIFMLIV